MRKQGIILVIVSLLAVILCGAVSAADNSSTTGGESSLSLNASEEVDPILWVTVGYEYTDDKINPQITVTDSNNNSVNFDKTKYSDTLYKLNFTYAGVTNGTLFNVLVQAPGYKQETQQVAVNQAGSDPEFIGSATFIMQATENYKLGREVTAIADQVLNFNTADDVLVITTAGVPHLHGTTTEDCIEGILNAIGGKVTYGNGNLLLLRCTPTDPVDFAFIVKRGDQLLVMFFLNGSTNPVYQGTISQNMQPTEWNNLIAQVGGENAYAYASLANAWEAGAPSDLLREAAFHGHMCQGTLSGYAVCQALMAYYPPVTDTQNPASPADLSAYKVISVPGDSDDDVYLNLLNTTPAKGYIGYDTTDTGATDNLVGFIRWIAGTTNKGDLIVMKFNKEELRQQYIAMGNTLSNDLDELKFNTWVLALIKNKEYLQLVTFVRELKDLNEEQYYTLLGTGNVGSKYNDILNPDGTVRISGREAKGLDLAYIDSLGLQQATRAVPTVIVSNPIDMKQVGIDAANLAKQIFLDEKGINLEKDSQNLLVQTTASYVFINGQSTDLAMEGVYEILGSRLSRTTLLPMHQAPWKILYFCFTLRGTDGETMDALYMTYDQEYNDPVTGHFRVGNVSDGIQVNNIGPAALNNQTQLNRIKQVFKNGGFFSNIQSIANSWRLDPGFDLLVTFLFHDHVCPGINMGTFIADKILENFPLGSDQEYFYMASSIYCKDDALVYLLGISPGMGTYMNQRLPNEDVGEGSFPGAGVYGPVFADIQEGVLVLWDAKNNVGQAMIINVHWPTLDMTGLTTNEAKAAAAINYFVNAYNDKEYYRMLTPCEVTSSDSTWITKEEFDLIKKGGTTNGNALEYLKTLPQRSREDLLAVQGGSETGQSDTSTGTSVGTVTGTSNGSGWSRFSSGSVGTTGNAVNAATETTTTEAGAQPASDAGKSYEVTKAGAEGTNDTPWGTYAVVGIVSVLALAGVGFFFKGNLFGR